MAWTTQKWLNLRATTAYVTDGANQIVVNGDGNSSPLKTYPYSVTLDSDTFNVGWSTGGGTDGARDRNASVTNKQLAGVQRTTNANGSPKIFKVELLGGVGSYEIRLAVGDPAGSGTTNPYVVIKDGTTTVATLDGTAGMSGWMDGTGVNRASDAAWGTDNAASTLTFSDTSGTGGTPVMYIECGSTATAGLTCLAAVGIKKVTSGPTVTSVSTATPREGASLTITGTSFGASQGAGDSTINGVSQTETSWGDTSVVVTVVLGTNKFGAAYNVVVTDNGGTPSNSYAGITGLLPANSGLSYVDVGTPNTTSAYRLTSSADLASGDQIEYDNKGGEVTVNSDGTFSAGPGVSSFNFRVWTSGSGYGPPATQLTAVGSGISDKWTIRPFNKRSGLGF